MVSSNARETTLWTPRTQEITHGFSPREMIDHDINPNEDSDGLSHHGRETPEDGESRDQHDSKKRKERAVRELSPPIPHVSIKPEKIDDTLGRSPQFEQEQKMIEAGIGLDLNRNGIGLSNGFNAGSVRSEGPNIKFGGSSSLVPRMLGKAIKDMKCHCGRQVWMPDNPNESCMFCGATDGSGKDLDSGEPEKVKNSDFGNTSNSEDFTTSEDVFTLAWDSILKGRRKYKGRRMYDDEESDEDEKKSKAKRKRKKKRQGKKKNKAAIGGRQIKSASKRRAAMKELDVDRGSKRQAFHPNKHSDALRNVGRSRNDAIPLRLRDPIAWERKKAYERNRRAVGSMPRGLSHHADTRGGMGTKGRSVLGGTKLPSVSRMGTSTSKFSRGATGDPLGVSDPLFSKMNPRLPKDGSLDGVLSRNPDPPAMNAGMPRDPDLLARLKRMHEAKKRAEEEFDPENSQYGINVTKAKTEKYFGENKNYYTLPRMDLTIPEIDELNRRMHIKRMAAKKNLEKASPNITRAEIMSMKRKIEKLLAKLNKLTKATPELGNEGKVGAQVNSNTGTAPEGGTKLNEEEKAPYRFVDIALAQEMGLVGKR